MGYTKEEIRQKFGGRLVVNKLSADLICEILTILPIEILDNLTKNVWVVNSLDDAWGFTFRGDELVGKHLIFLSDELFSEDKNQVSKTLLHEVGHVVLNHQNSILKQQSPEEIAQQEHEAESFVNKYLQS